MKAQEERSAYGKTRNWKMRKASVVPQRMQSGEKMLILLCKPLARPQLEQPVQFWMLTCESHLGDGFQKQGQPV